MISISVVKQLFLAATFVKKSSISKKLTFRAWVLRHPLARCVLLMISKYCSFWGADGVQYAAVTAYSVLRSLFEKVLYKWCQHWVNIFAHNFIAKLLWRERTGQSMKWHSVSCLWSEWEALKQVSWSCGDLHSGPCPSQKTWYAWFIQAEIWGPYYFLDGFVPNFFCRVNGAFYKAGLAMWNSLPLRIRQISNFEIFRKELKAFNLNRLLSYFLSFILF